MFSVKGFIEEGVKFIIPPPKYHPFPNAIPVLNSTFISEKMAGNNPYHIIPADEPTRPSMERFQGMINVFSIQILSTTNRPRQHLRASQRESTR